MRGICGYEVRQAHPVLRSAMRQALRWRLLPENPVDGVKIPRNPRGEMRSLTVEQAQTFLKAAVATPHGPVLAVALTTGDLKRPNRLSDRVDGSMIWPMHRRRLANSAKLCSRGRTYII